MIVGDDMEILLCVEGTSQEKRQVAIGSLDDMCDLIDGLTPIEGLFICEPIFNDVGECDA